MNFSFLINVILFEVKAISLAFLALTFSYGSAIANYVLFYFFLYLCEMANYEGDNTATSIVSRSRLFFFNYILYINFNLHANETKLTIKQLKRILKRIKICNCLNIASVICILKYNFNT